MPGAWAPQARDVKRNPRILARYLITRPRVVIEFKWQSAQHKLRVHADADWVGCKSTRKSTSRGALMFGQHAFTPCSEKQSLLSLGPGESEFYAALNASAKERDSCHYSSIPIRKSREVARRCVGRRPCHPQTLRRQNPPHRYRLAVDTADRRWIDVIVQQDTGHDQPGGPHDHISDNRSQRRSLCTVGCTFRSRKSQAKSDLDLHI